jgi:hypothetical protein
VVHQEAAAALRPAVDRLQEVAEALLMAVVVGRRVEGAAEPPSVRHYFELEWSRQRTSSVRPGAPGSYEGKPGI